jgi:protein involved in polysaccharide export with SLBB domain
MTGRYRRSRKEGILYATIGLLWGGICYAQVDGSGDAANTQGRSSLQSNYIIATDDLVQVKVYQEPDLDALLRVPGDGSISVSLIGPVRVAGRSAREAAAAIRELLAKNYIVTPQVTVSVMEYSKRRFTVLGQVQRPGSYYLPDREEITLLQAIGLAGGYTRIADPGKITVKRKSGVKETLFRLNGKSIASGKQSEFVIQPGDTVTVGESIF